jgi:hypothetical protein
MYDFPYSKLAHQSPAGYHPEKTVAEQPADLEFLRRKEAMHQHLRSHFENIENTIYLPMMEQARLEREAAEKEREAAEAAEKERERERGSESERALKRSKVRSQTQNNFRQRQTQNNQQWTAGTWDADEKHRFLIAMRGDVDDSVSGFWNVVSDAVVSKSPDQCRKNPRANGL